MQSGLITGVVGEAIATVAVARTAIPRHLKYKVREQDCTLWQAVVEVGSGINSGVSAVGSHLDRMNENLSRGLHLGGG